ncbi:MAG: hypothetical protein J6R79_01080 [Bacteroidaceae bacterium]|nr:hypothetical protein [Bacteroidaceae bacterium]
MKRILKIFLTFLLVVLFLLLASWFYRIIVLMMLVRVWRERLKALRPWAYQVAMWGMVVGLFVTLPRYRYDTNDRVRLIYQDKEGNPKLPPVSHWLFNALLPEEEICNAGILGGALLPDFVPIGGWILKDFRRDLACGKIWNFYVPYNQLNWRLDFPMSGTTAQLFNEVGIDKEQSVYVIRPKHFDAEKKYPVVFFMHGYLGNWKLYNGIFKDLDNCIVMCVGTKDLSGIFKHSDIQTLFTRQIPFLEKLGFKPDKENLHIVGLSNGGSATNVAYADFSKKFKTITYISTGIHHTFPIKSKVLLIGGGKDPSSTSIPGAYRTIHGRGGKVAKYWDKDEGHFILVNDRTEIIDFLKDNL